MYIWCSKLGYAWAIGVESQCLPHGPYDARQQIAGRRGDSNTILGAHCSSCARLRARPARLHLVRLTTVSLRSCASAAHSLSQKPSPLSHSTSPLPKTGKAIAKPITPIIVPARRPYAMLKTLPLHPPPYPLPPCLHPPTSLFKRVAILDQARLAEPPQKRYPPT